MKIQILVDNPNSWIIPFAKDLKKDLEFLGHSSSLIFSHENIEEGDILFLLSCEKILSQHNRKKHKNNVIAHESFLPQGKGWSPVTWQILEGLEEIPVTLLEAEDKVDSGPIYLQETFRLSGSELINEIREKQGLLTKKLCIQFTQQLGSIKASVQTGSSSYYPRRTPQDSRLDPFKTLAEQFNLLRVSDNERYPAYFELHGEKYYLKIFKEE